MRSDSLYFRYKSPENYYHFLVYMISNLRHIDYEDVSHVYFDQLLPHLFVQSSYVIEILQCFLPKLYRCTNNNSPPDNVLEVPYIPLPENLSRNDPYSMDSYLFLRENLIPHAKIYNMKHKYDRIYISRSRATHRKILNETDFEEYLKSHNFHTLFLEDLGGIEQMAYFYNASVIISPHGAGLTNILFCKEGTEIIEIASNLMSSMEHFSHIAEIMKLKYMRYQNVIASSDSVDSNMIINYDKLTFESPIPRKKTFTVRRGDGFGSQYHGFMAGIAFCEYNKEYVYAHTPITSIEHNLNKDELNAFIGIPFDTNQKEIDRIEDFPKEVHNCPVPEKYYTQNVRDFLRKMYFSTKKPALNPNEIAIHIRRGDVKQSDVQRYTTNNQYKYIISKLRSIYPNEEIHIHSEGDVNEFVDLIGGKTFLHLNEPMEISFHSLVTAKVLVTSKSSFSYTAAILSVGKVYYIPFWHIPFQNWEIL